MCWRSLVGSMNTGRGGYPFLRVAQDAALREIEMQIRLASYAAINVASASINSYLNRYFPMTASSRRIPMPGRSGTICRLRPRRLLWPAAKRKGLIGAAEGYSVVRRKLTTARVQRLRLHRTDIPTETLLLEPLAADTPSVSNWQASLHVGASEQKECLDDHPEPSAVSSTEIGANPCCDCFFAPSTPSVTARTLR
jgi:hypothetical protein